MENRINYRQTEPKAIDVLLELDKYVHTTALSETHKHLVKIRASQINGCAYCINSHTKDARKAGETEQRIYALNAWRDTILFTEDERAVLALTEEVTLITKEGLSDDTYNKAIELFGEHYTAQLIMAVININAWNRMGVATRMKFVADKQLTATV